MIDKTLIRLNQENEMEIASLFIQIVSDARKAPRKKGRGKQGCSLKENLLKAIEMC